MGTPSGGSLARVAIAGGPLSNTPWGGAHKASSGPPSSRDCDAVLVSARSLVLGGPLGFGGWLYLDMYINS